MASPFTLEALRRASRPYGVATHERLRQRLTQRQIDHLVATSALARPHHGVYVDPAVPRSPLQDLAVAVAAGGPMAAAWGRSAGGLWELTPFPSTPEIVVPEGRVRRVPGVFVRRSRWLPPSHVMLHRHIRVTRPLRTAVDLGVVLGARELAAVIVRARQMKLFQPAAFEAEIRRLARSGRDGISTARDAFRLVMIGDRPADSVLELHFNFLAHDFGLPPFEYQFTVEIRGKRYRIDFAYPEVRLAIEVDGYEERASTASMEYDPNGPTV